MKLKLKKPSGLLSWPGLLLALVPMFLQTSFAQQGSQGNTTVFGGAQMSFFSNHNFVTGGVGAQPGVILTERLSGNFGVLNFVGTDLLAAGASDAGYVDGYVRKYGSGQFIFPVGDNGFLGQFAASGDGTMGAYFHGDPNNAVTSNLFTGSDYTALPSGEPFATSSMGENVDVVSTIEYWDIDGSATTSLTLTWDAASGIAALTGSQLNKLTIVGWNGSEWVAINSTVDITSVLGGASDLSAGSITTNSSLAPESYIAYTFASLVSPLPVTLISFDAKAEGATAFLEWSTTEETNSDRFEIERSFNGKIWQKIGSLQSAGESSTFHQYNYTDVNPVVGQNYYRLKMVDHDNLFAYSHISSINFRGEQMIFAYPNPATDRLLIRNFERIHTAQLVNAAGQIAVQTRTVTSEGINVAHLPKGLYILKVALMDGSTNAHKIAILR